MIIDSSVLRLDPQNYALAIAFFLNLILTVVIYTSSKKRKDEISFAILALSVAFWALGMFLYRGILNNDVSAVLVTKWYYVFAGIIPASFLYFSLNYPVKQEWLSRSSKFLLSIFAIFFIVSPLYDSFIVQRVIVQSVGENQIFFGIGLLLWGFYTVVYFTIAFFFLLRELFFSKTANSVAKNQYKFIIIGSFISVLVGVTTNHILPLFFGDPSLAWLGPTSSLVMTLSIATAIYKYGLFNTKLIITEILIFFVWVALLVNLLLSTAAGTFVPNIFILGIVVILGIFVIRSVKREVSQREHIEKLAENLGAANESLSVANEKLKGLDKLKSEFLSLASHQLRSPLTAIKGYTSMLAEGSYGKLEEKQKEVIGNVLISTQSLISMVEDFLNVSKIEQGGMQYVFGPTPLAKLVSDLFAEMKITAQNNGLDFTLTMDPGDAFTINADAGKLRQVFLNLIDNSIKYTPSGFVHLSLTRNKNKNTVTFSVEDTGAGISAEEKEKLFEKFKRGDGQKLNSGGSGLGLYLAREIVKAHNGRILVESEGKGKGSCFGVELGAGDNAPSN